MGVMVIGSYRVYILSVSGAMSSQAICIYGQVLYPWSLKIYVYIYFMKPLTRVMLNFLLVILVWL